LLFLQARKIDPQSLHVAYNFALMLLNQQRIGEAVEFWLSFRKMRSMDESDSRVLRAPPHGGVVVAVGLAAENDALCLDSLISNMAKQTGVVKDVLSSLSSF
jgi:hypothetical protein